MLPVYHECKELEPDAKPGKIKTHCSWENKDVAGLVWWKQCVVRTNQVENCGINYEGVLRHK